MKLFLLGSGYVGEAFGKAQKAQGHEIIASSRFPEKIPLLKTWANDAIVWTGQVPSGIDAALFACAPKGEGYKETYLDNAHLLANSNLPYILYTSSTSVYGDQQGNFVTEESLLNPQNPSQQILIETEKALPSQSCIFRLGEIIGPGRELENKVLPGKTFPGTGDQYVNISPLALILKALELALNFQLKGIYNLTSDLHPTRKELYDEIARKKGISPPIWDPTLATLHGGNKRVKSDKFYNELKKILG